MTDSRDVLEYLENELKRRYNAAQELYEAGGSDVLSDACLEKHRLFGLILDHAAKCAVLMRDLEIALGLGAPE
ncbi:hypothetical protein IMW75_03290 [Pseudomonas gregormendelii]|uniref:Uncharacterized protein n=1 Tax=Pseudomonas gregormendelii TaxID=1628277 RepID=A0ABS3AAV8_9PSED|nr:hypothetical protein [Pseudomonas gregormendelii]MBN3964309.1 hypothetical protein [Pseudomonas gregormendelii]